MSEQELVDVTGIVSNIKREKESARTTFKIYCPNMGQSFDAVCDMFCPLHQSDTISALCQFNNNRLYVARPPFVQPAMDRDSIVQCFVKALKKGFKPAIDLYNCISKVAGGDHNVTQYLSIASQEWWENHDYDNLMMYEKQDPDLVKKLFNWWHKERNLRRLYLLGLTKTEINNCNMLCDDIYNSCIKNPFTLASISMEKCDIILQRLQKTCELNERICGSIVRVVYQKMTQNSWSAVPSKMLIKQFPDLATHLPLLESDYHVVMDNQYQCAYLKYPHKIELEVAEIITDLARQNRISYETPLDEVITCEDGTLIERLSAVYNTNFELSKDQQKAIQGALDHSISIITGPAGTGKSLCIAQIVNNLELRAVKYAVCSFTGKAVAVLRDKTKRRNPATIHRLIASSRRDPTAKKSKSTIDLIFPDFEHIVIDEASMVTSELFHKLMRAYPNVKKMTFVGDVNQLEPIGWGALFHQLVKSQTIPTYKLTTNYRVYTVEGERDGVIMNANNLIKYVPNEFILFEFVETNNFSIEEGPIERVYDIVKIYFQHGIKAEDLVIITPFNRVLKALNNTVQKIYDVGNRFKIDSRNVKWIIGDIVMLNENDKEINVFNGEKGIIIDINDKSISVEFPASGVHDFLLEPKAKKKSYYKNGTTFKSTNSDVVMDGYEDEYDSERTVMKLDHAYAITVDKSQGSEWNFVIFYIPEFSMSSFINRNRIYTAITRAKRACWSAVPDIETFNKVAVVQAPYRCDNLCRRLSSVLPNIHPYVNMVTDEKLLNEMFSDIPQDYFDMGYDSDDQ